MKIPTIESEHNISSKTTGICVCTTQMYCLSNPDQLHFDETVYQPSQNISYGLNMDVQAGHARNHSGK